MGKSSRPIVEVLGPRECVRNVDQVWVNPFVCVVVDRLRYLGGDVKCEVCLLEFQSKVVRVRIGLHTMKL